jgi:hypothetical protein
MLSTAVIPEGERAGLPLEAALELWLLNVSEEHLQEGRTFGL